VRIVGMLAIVLWVTGCSTVTTERRTTTPLLDKFFSEETLPEQRPLVDEDTLLTQQADEIDDSSSEPESKLAEEKIYKGTEVTINTKVASSTSSHLKRGKIRLDFKNADIKLVIKSVLGDILGKTYSIDPNITGNITVRSQIPLAKQSILPVLETVLKMNGTVLIVDGDHYKVMSILAANHETSTPRLGKRPGYGIRIFPLQYIAANEMKKILKPLVSRDNDVTELPSQNHLVIRGTGPELSNIAETIAIFDVDWLEGVSIAMLPVDYADTATIAKEIGQIVDNDKSAMRGMVKIIPMTRLNALIAISQQPRYLEHIRKWVKRLDKAVNEAGQQMHVYYVKNSEATELASLLNNMIGSVKKSKKVSIAPGHKLVEQSTTGNTNSGIQLTGTGEIGIFADNTNNALLIISDQQNYKMILSALQKLDVKPLQVLVEVTIAEVQLNDDLRYGVQWFLRDQKSQNQGSLNFGSSNPISSTIPGFSYTYLESIGDVRAIFDTIASNTDAKIISRPSIMVLNSETAVIQVGNQVPVLTQQQQSVTGSSGDNASALPTVVNSIQYKDTGILLEVTPRVNVGGMVKMKITQEVSDAVSNSLSGIDSPVVSKRKVNTKVAIKSGQTVVLGGFIKEKKNQVQSGIPWLSSIPYLGHLFSTTSSVVERTELLVMISPVIIGAHNRQDITQEYHKRMRDISLSSELE
jgi:general secretion pathway protein D